MDAVRSCDRIERRIGERGLRHRGEGAWLNESFPAIEHLERLVSVYAPGHCLRDKDGLDVRVGNYVAPRGGPEIRTRLLELLYRATRERSITAWQAHVEYEMLHPFTDGNGRSGRALWLWMMDEAPLGFLHHFYHAYPVDTHTYP